MPIPTQCPGAPPAGTIQLRKVKVLWLRVTDTENYLLLEDTETGDVLLPLIYMKSIFEANYSRKLSSLKHRLVVPPPQYQASLENKAGKKRSIGEAEVKSDFLYWQWAFEAPHEVKVLVRQALGEENTPHGHLRLILLPIVFNAMAQKQKLRALPLFKALHAALSRSAYFSLLKLPQNVEAELAEMNQSRLSLSIGDDGVDGQPLFSGPFDLDKTIAKYTLTCEVAEEIQSSKRARAAFTGRMDAHNRLSPPLETGSPSSQANGHENGKHTLKGEGFLSEESETLAHIRRQTEEMTGEVRRLRGECEANMNWIYMELHNLKRWMAEVMQSLVANTGGPSGMTGIKAALPPMTNAMNGVPMQGVGGVPSGIHGGVNMIPAMNGAGNMRDMCTVNPATFCSMGAFTTRPVPS